MSSDFNPTEWITTTEAAELTGYTATHFRRLIANGHLQAVKRAKTWFLRKKDVLAYAEEMERLGSAKYDPWRTGARERKEER